MWIAKLAYLFSLMFYLFYQFTHGTVSWMMGPDRTDSYALFGFLDY